MAAARDSAAPQQLAVACAALAAAGAASLQLCGGGGRSSRGAGGRAPRAGRALEQQYTGDGLLESGGGGPGPTGGPPQPPSAVDASRFLGATSAKQLRICVLGGGNFGTAMAYAASRNGHAVTIWMRDAAQARTLNETRRNPRYLSDFPLPPNVSATTDLAAAMAGVQLIIHCLPCQQTPEWLATHRDAIPPDVLICSTAKGLYLPTQQVRRSMHQDCLLNPL